TLASVQRLEDGRLHERFGPFDLVLEGSVDADGAFLLTSSGCRLAGPVPLPLPAFLAPRVASRTWAEADGRIHVQVRVASRLAGPLLTYEGTVMLEEVA